MLRARLLIEGGPLEQEEIAALLAGKGDAAIIDVEVSTSGELLTHHLRPLRVEAVSPAVADDPDDERTGPLIRLYTTRPDEEAEPDGSNNGSTAASADPERA